MTISASTNWYVRAGGNEINGGGYDATISGAGTNYADQDAHQLGLTDLATSGAGSTTLTSATGGFTSAMIGNCIRIASGANFQAGYYFVTGYTNTNTVTLDRTPTSGGAGSGGTGRLGGAHASLKNYTTGGTGPSPAISSPLAPGHIINIRGSGNDNPGTSDFDFSAGYWTVVSGDQTNGAIRLRGYNGRPRISHHGLLLYQPSYWIVENISWFQAAGTFVQYGPVSSGSLTGNCSAINCKFDQNGYDAIQFSGRQAVAFKCEFTNSGSQTSGSQGAVYGSHVWTICIGCTFHGLRGPAIYMTGACAVAQDCLFYGNNSDDIYQAANDSTRYGDVVRGNTFYGGAGHGINVASSGAAWTLIQNNIIAGKTSSGKKGINFADAEALNARLMLFPVGNNFFHGNTANYGNFSLRSDDVDLTADPFTNAAGNDFSLNNTAGGGAAVRAAGTPGSWPNTSTTNYLDGGAAQAQASASSSGVGPRVVQVGGGLGFTD